MIQETVCVKAPPRANFISFGAFSPSDCHEEIHETYIIVVIIIVVVVVVIIKEVIVININRTTIFLKGAHWNQRWLQLYGQ